MGSIRGESSTRDNMVNRLLFSSLLLVSIGNSATAIDAVERFANDGSHDLKCYVPGQCSEFAVDFQASVGPDECGTFCHEHNANEDVDVHRCNWWSWDAAQELCIMFHNCTQQGGRPDGTQCPHCLTGQESCERRKCVMDVKCKGHLASGSLKQFTAGSLRECISSCHHHSECNFYTFENNENNTNFCVLYEECDKDPKTDEYMPGTGCQTGELSCSLGHLPASIVTEANGFLTANTHMHALNRKFDKTMEEICNNQSGSGKYLVGDDNDRCKHFIDCNKEIVMECDVDYAFNEDKEECYNIHDNYKKSDVDQVMCKGSLLKSSRYHHTYGGPSNN